MRKIWVLMLALPAIAFGPSLAVQVVTGVTPAAYAAVPAMAVDVDLTNGVCTTMDAAKTVNQGSGTFQAAVCLVGHAGAVDAFNFQLLSDQAKLSVGALSGCTGQKIDCGTVDINDGTSQNGVKSLSSDEGWACSTIPGPSADNVAATSGANSNGVFSGPCLNLGGTTNTGTDPVELGRVTYTVCASCGSTTDTLTLGGSSAATTNNPSDGTAAVKCDGTLGGPCGSATITIQAPQGQPTSTNTALPTSTGTATVTSTPCTGSCPEATREAAKTRTPTPTAIGTASAETPTPVGATPAGGLTPSATARGGAGPDLTGPDTGSGSATSGSSGFAGPGMTLVAAIVAIVAGGAVFGAGALRRRKSATKP